MQRDGTETLAVWRETGEWWKGEKSREVRRILDSRGVRRETMTELADCAGGRSDVRVRRILDEKVSMATGSFQPMNYGRPRHSGVGGVLLHGMSAYSLGGTMLASELAALAAEKGYGTVLLADRFSLCGAREFCSTAEKVGVVPLVGVTVTLPEGGDLVLVARDKIGYRSLSRLVTECHLGEPRTYPLASWDRLGRHSEGVLCLSGGSNGLLDLLLARRELAKAKSTADHLVEIYGKPNVFFEIERSYLPWQSAVSSRLFELAQHCGVTCVGGGPVLYSDRGHFPSHDVLVCVDTLCLIEEIEGRKPFRDDSQPVVSALPRRSLNSERHLLPHEEREELFSDARDLVDNAHKFAGMCERDVLPGRTELPQFCKNEPAALRQLVECGAVSRYGKMTSGQKRRLDMETDRLSRLGWSRHFLIAWEMCEWARGEQILFSGRGSVVDSMVAYCLGLTRIDAYGFKLHFDRFLPPDGSKRPDIDIDFEAERREDVRQHLVGLYGDGHVATVAAIGTYRTRGIIREVGKVMGIPDDQIGFLAKRIHGGVSPDRLVSALEKRPELRGSKVPKEKYHWVFEFAERLADLPRNLRAHSSGVVISSTPLADTVPVQFSGAEGVKIIQWDKRTAKHYFDKFDVLCLRGNDVLGGTMRRVSGLDVCDLPVDDPEVYRTMRSGKLIGIPQSASPAMRQAHVRIGTKDLKDAGIVQAGIRPGVGGAVKLNEYIARRKGKPFRYVHPEFEDVLGPTLGIVVFQEQIDQLLSKFGGYTGDEAEEIRDAVQRHHDRKFEGEACVGVVARVLERGYPPQVAKEVFDLVAGFKGYGFAEGHALAFAEVSVRSVYCQQNYPAPYFAALLDAQPAGYYGPTTIANEARLRGVKVLGPDVNLSEGRFGVEDVRSDSEPALVFPDGGIRVPLRQISGLSGRTLERSLAGRPFGSMFDYASRVCPDRDELESLVMSGAFDSICSHRRAMLWAVNDALDCSRSGFGEGCLPLLFDDPPLPLELTDFSEIEKGLAERKLMGMDVARHLMAFERERVTAKGGLSAAEASVLESLDQVFVVGCPIRLRFPPTQSGKRVLFFDLEDETGLLNVTCFDDVYQRDGHKVVCSPFVTVSGRAQNRDGHIAFLAERIFAYRPGVVGGVEGTAIPVTIGDFLMG